MNRAVGLRVWHGLLVLVAMLAACLPLAPDAATQSRPPPTQLVAADPAPNARLAAAPDEIALTFSVSVAPESTWIGLLGAGGVAIPLESVRVEAESPARLLARPAGSLGSGDYTVVWSARAADDGALLAGAYPFRAGVAANPGAADGPNQWPAPWAALLRWLVFLGAAIAGGGFAWWRLLTARPGHRAPESRPRLGAMAMAALVALLATVLTPVLALFAGDGGESFAFMTMLRAMPLGWWLQAAALVVLSLLCLAVLMRGSVTIRERARFDWVGVGAGAAAVGGLGFTSHAASPLNVSALAVELVHLWSTALWFSGVLFFLAGWRGLGSDVARFRTVRWVGGLLLAVSVATGLARAALLFPSLGDLVANRYGQVLAGKTGVVLVVFALGGAAMLGPGQATAAQASRFLGTQGVCAGLAALLAAFLALMTTPGSLAPTTLAGVALGDVVPLDPSAFDAESGFIHLLTQPAMPGAQTVVVRLTDADGTPLSSARPPTVEVIWTALGADAPPEQQAVLQADPAGAVFTGAAALDAGWQQADVTITPLGGVASRARFWLVVPDPNVAGAGPTAVSDPPEAMALYDRGLASLTALRSVRYTQRLGDGGGSLTRSRVSVSAAEGERPAAYDETVVGADGAVLARQTIVGNRRWLLEEGAWVAAEPIAFLAPAAWGEIYAGATGFELGPREAVDGELSQVVTFWVPPRDDPVREPAWYAWWVGLASGQVRREAMVSTRHYMAAEYRDFNAELGIAAPVVERMPIGTPTAPVATPGAPPTGEAGEVGP